MKIYADNAATTKMSSAAIHAMLPYMDEIYGNPSSLHTAGQQAKEALEDARQRIATLLNCDAREITFTSGGSEADNQAILSAAYLGERKGKKHIISTAFEHHAVLHTLDKLRIQGFEITLLNVPENGLIEPAEVAAAIRPDTCLVTIMYANNEIGTIQPIAKIGDICHEKMYSSTQMPYKRRDICTLMYRQITLICFRFQHTNSTARRASAFYMHAKESL